MKECSKPFDKSQFLNSTFTLPKKPYCCNEFTQLRIRTAHQARRFKYIQANGPLTRNYLILDIDRPGAAWAHESTLAPSPNFITLNHENGHGHAVYCLHDPVWADQPGSMRFFADVERKFIHAFDSDPGFSGFLTRNPYTHHIRPIHNQRYTLDDLNLATDLPTITVTETIGYGRNCIIFDQVRIWAYDEVRKYRKTYGGWFDAILARCQTLNLDFTYPLTSAEVAGIARSVHKFTIRMDNEAAKRFKKRQADKGRKGGIQKGLNNQEKKEQARELKKEGFTLSKIAKIVKVNRSTLYRWNI